MKILNGREMAGFIKEAQAQMVAAMPKDRRPKLVILRDSDDPVISKYVGLKVRYGEEIGVKVEDLIVKTEDLVEKILELNQDDAVSGMILQLPIKKPESTEEIVNKIRPEKDVDGLGCGANFDSATATAINWLLAGYGIELERKKIAVVGRGKLVGAPLIRMWENSGHRIEVFKRGDDLSRLVDFEVVVTATGVPHLIKAEMIRGGAVVVDAGTASENGVIVGDLDEKVRERTDLLAVTPIIGGVGPLTVAVLFGNVIRATG